MGIIKKIQEKRDSNRKIARENEQIKQASIRCQEYDDMITLAIYT